MLDINKIRQDFPLLSETYKNKPIIYFDNAATTQKPKSVIKAIQDYYEHFNSNIHRGAHFLGDKATEAFESSRETVKDFLNAEKSQEIIFTKNTTEAINIIAHGFIKRFMKKGDEMILSRMEHHSNFIPWIDQAQKYDIKIKLIDIDQNGRLKYDNLDQIFTKKTKLVAITQASNVLGTINPLEKIINWSKKVGAKVLIDASQSAPHLIPNIKELNCDFLAFTGHKICGPTGTGVLYGKTELLEEIPPLIQGGGMIHEVFEDRYTTAELPNKFEGGTPNIAGVIGLEAAIKYLQEIGKKNIQEYEHQLTKYMLKKLKETPFIRLIGSNDNKDRLPVFSFIIEDIHPHDISDILSHEGICVRAGHHCCQPLMKHLELNATTRASLYFYNTIDEIDRFIEKLYRVKEIFR